MGGINVQASAQALNATNRQNIYIVSMIHFRYNSSTNQSPDEGLTACFSGMEWEKLACYLRVLLLDHFHTRVELWQFPVVPWFVMLGVDGAMPVIFISSAVEGSEDKCSSTSEVES